MDIWSLREPEADTKTKVMLALDNKVLQDSDGQVKKVIIGFLG
jgi:hypothetical protein